MNNTVLVHITLDYKNVLTGGSQYCVPSRDLDKDFGEWINCYTSFDSIVVGGEFNVHRKALGSSREDERTELLMEHLMTNNLFILNDPGADHTWTFGDKKRRLKFALGDTVICDRITSWSVDSKHFSFSHHTYMEIVLDFKPQLRKSITFKTKNKSFMVYCSSAYIAKPSQRHV